MVIPPASSATTSQPVPVPGNTGAILQLPPSLTTAQIGDILEGTVAARLPNATVTIETPAGPLVLRTGLPLPPNTAVLLQITSGGRQPAVTITTQPATGAPAVAGGAIATPPPNAAALNVVTALVTRTLSVSQPDTTPPALRLSAPPVAGGDGPNLSASLPTGARLPVRIVSVVPPSGAIPGSGPQARPAATAAAATRGILSGISPQAASPGPATATAAQATPPAGFAAKIMGTNVVGQPVIRAGNLELTLPAGRPLPTGGTLFLERAGAPFLPVIADTELQQTLAVAQRWEALSQALNNSGSPALRAALQHLIPQPNLQLAGAFLFFMAALRGGDPRSWLGGDIARQLDSDGFLGRIGEEFGLMQRLAAEPAGQDWRLFLIPLLTDGQLHQLRLFIRGNRDDSGDTGDAAGVRFVIEASFSRLGPFQFDGLVQARNMNLVIRTERALEEAIRRDIMNIYGTSLQALGLTGHIEFRAEPFFEVQPLAESGLIDHSEILA